MKRNISVLLIAVLAISLLAGCQTSSNDDSISDPGSQEQSIQEPGIPSQDDLSNATEDTTQTDADDYIVEWTDPIVEQLIRRYLEAGDGDIYRSDLDGITRFVLEPIYGGQTKFKIYVNSTSEIANVDFMRMEDVQHFHNLKELQIAAIPLDNITFVSELTNLENLRLIRCDIEDITPIANLTNLRVLTLDDNNIEDLTPMASLTNLENVRLYTNNIQQLDGLSGLQNMTQLGLGNNEIADYSPLYGLNKLKYLHLGSGTTEEMRDELRQNMPFCSISSFS